MTCTGAVVSKATDLDSVLDEISSSRFTERGTRIDDQRSETSLEDRKRDGYF
jgi:sulfate adenylyltransferase subunit 2